MQALAKSFLEWINAGLGWIYPEVCQICGVARATPAESFLCLGCRSQVRLVQPPCCEQCGAPFQGSITQAFTCNNCSGREWHFRSARSALIARGVALEVIHHYKYRRALWFEPFLAEALVSRARPELLSGDWQAIVPVPLHPTKQREREFNQAERLARQLSHATGIPLCKRWLRRVRPTRTQTQLSREERQENMKDAFAWRGNEQLHGSRVVLVDDVFTTGATTNACAKVLRQAGASEIVVWTLARGL